MVREINPLDIASSLTTEPSFRVSLRGYRRKDVDHYASVAEGQIAELIAERHELQTRMFGIAEELRALQMEVVELRRRPAIDETISFKHLGYRVDHILKEAEEQAAAIRAGAQEVVERERSVMLGEMRQVRLDLERGFEEAREELEAEFAQVRKKFELEEAEFAQRRNKAEAEFTDRRAKAEASYADRRAKAEAEYAERRAQAESDITRARDEAKRGLAAAQQEGKRLIAVAQEEAKRELASAREEAQRLIVLARIEADRIAVDAQAAHQRDTGSAAARAQGVAAAFDAMVSRVDSSAPKVDGVQASGSIVDTKTVPVIDKSTKDDKVATGPGGQAPATKDSGAPAKDGGAPASKDGGGPAKDGGAPAGGAKGAPSAGAGAARGDGPAKDGPGATDDGSRTTKEEVVRAMKEDPSRTATKAPRPDEVVRRGHRPPNGAPGSAAPATPATPAKDS